MVRKVYSMALTFDLGLSASVAGSCCIFTLAVRQPPVLASCIEIYYYGFIISDPEKLQIYIFTNIIASFHFGGHHLETAVLNLANLITDS